MDAKKYDDYVKRLPISANDYAALTEQSPVTVSRKRHGKLPIPYFEAALMTAFVEPTRLVQLLVALEMQRPLTAAMPRGG